MTMPSVFSAGTDVPRGTRPRKMLWSSRSMMSFSSCGLLLCSVIVSVPVSVSVAGSSETLIV